LVLFFQAGCYHHTYNLGDRNPEAEPSVERWHDHFLFGTIDADDPVDVAEVCQAGAFRVEDQQTALNGLVSVATLGIYTPRKEKVVCVQPE
jgi:hypothetical protein